MNPDDIINALVKQRDAALGDSVMLAAANAGLQRKIHQLEEQLHVCKEQDAAPTSDPEPAPRKRTAK